VHKIANLLLIASPPKFLTQGTFPVFSRSLRYNENESIGTQHEAKADMDALRLEVGRFKKAADVQETRKHPPEGGATAHHSASASSFPVRLEPTSQAASCSPIRLTDLRVLSAALRGVPQEAR
jgi:hypothetical protein